MAGVLGLATVGDDEPAAPADEVLGQTFEREEAPEPPLETRVNQTDPSTVSLVPDEGQPVAPAPVVRESAAAATAPSPSPTTTAAPGVAAVEGRPARGTRVVEHPDTAQSFEYRNGQMAARASSRTEPGHVDFAVECFAVDGHGRAPFTIVNRSGGDVFFPEGGLLVKIMVSRPDGTTRTYEVRDPSMTKMTKGGGAEGQVDFPLIADGTYSCGGDLPVEY